MKSIVLAAGYATRLYPLTLNKPKPLLEIAEKPMVEHILSKIEEVDDVDEIFIVTNDKFYNNFVEWLKGYSSNKKIKIVNDMTKSNEDRLGSIGDVSFVIEKEDINDDTLVIAGDNLFEFSLKDVVNVFKKRKTTVVALYDVNDFELAKKYGIVSIDKNNKIIDFKEKPKKPESTLASTGVYIYPRNILKFIVEYAGKGESDKTGNFLEWLYKKKDIYCYISDKRWYDIGSFEQLEEAKKEFMG